MFIDDPKISPFRSATFREYILLPRKTEPGHALHEVSLATKLADECPLAIPFVSAAMEAVTGDQLAISLALHGGIGVLPAGRVETPEQIRQIEVVKSYRDGFSTDFLTVTPGTLLGRVDELEAQLGLTNFPVVGEDGRFFGEISTRDYHPIHDLPRPVSERLRVADKLLTCDEGQPHDEVAELLLTSSYNRCYILSERGTLNTVVFRDGLKREQRYHNATRDEKGRLKVAAAISTHPEDRERARECVAAGVDLFSIDASDGYSEYMLETIRHIKTWKIPVIAGNVVDEHGFEFLAEAGADAVKVGIGSGSICTTRRVKAIGRGQATAIRRVVLARDEWFKRTGKYIPIVSDGGVAGSGDMSVALCMGADALMMGKYFAGFHESPTIPFLKRVKTIDGDQVSVNVKPYWGEASAKAKNVRRYQQNDPRTFVIEGEEGYVLGKGSIHDCLPVDLKAIKGTLSSCGCSELETFRRDVMVERQTVGSQQEGGISIQQG